MTTCDLVNMLGVMDECLMKIQDHLENGNPDRALIRTQETRKVIKRLQARFDTRPKHHPPDKVCV